MDQVLCWGSTKHGELGLGGIEEECITKPLVHKALAGKVVVSIACGVSHSLFVLADGSLLSAGCNDSGQLGRTGPCKRPGMIEELNGQFITRAAAGEQHSMALTDTGQVYTWGGNSFHQLGRMELESTESCDVPRLVKRLSYHTVIQIATGHHHNVVLTNRGEVYVWGNNNFGQLGLGHVLPCPAPTLLSVLRHLPLVCVAAGKGHTAFLSFSGALYTCGNNQFGQLGPPVDSAYILYPMLVKALRHQQIRYVCCGAEHTASLTKDGGVFTFGSSRYGQLGHGNREDEGQPTRVFELMGSTVTQLACGRHHTAAYCGGSNRLYLFGQGGCGQLGLSDTTNRPSPTLLKQLFRNNSTANNECNSEVFCGGDQTFFLMRCKPNCSAVDFRAKNRGNGILHLSASLIEMMCHLNDDRIPENLADNIEGIFSTPACINASFLLSSEEALAVSKTHSGVNMEEAQRCLQKLDQVKNLDLLSLICGCLETHLLPSLGPFPDVETLRIFLLLPLLPLMHKPELKSLALGFAAAVVVLEKIPSTVLAYWWRTYEPHIFSKFIDTYKRCVLDSVQELTKSNLYERQQRLKEMILSMQMLKRLHQANALGQPRLVNYQQFYMPSLRDHINIKHDYVMWMSRQHATRVVVPADTFSFYDYPFIFDGPTKTEILHMDAALKMEQAVEEVQRRNLMSLMMPITPDTPLLLLNVSREHIVRDTLKSLEQHKPGDLKKPLRVQFLNEEAVDEGGVKKEFFMLLVRELMDPKYNMFTYFEESRYFWFSEHTYEEPIMFLLIGALCGLAIYNNVIIELPFPLALYKLLLNRDLSLDDLKELIPAVGRSLQELLDYTESDFEEVFDLTFAVDRNHFGVIKQHDIVPGGREKRVTQENKLEYVEAYVGYQFRGAVDKALTAFCQGFHRVVEGGVLNLFEPIELQSMVIGNEQYDWTLWQQHAAYKPDYSPNHPVIKMFWEVFSEFSQEIKKKFLFFLTGSDRVPITGMKSIQIRFQPVHGGESFLPVAHTCFNLLDLPQYTDKNTMKMKLLQAITETKGFGLI